MTADAPGTAWYDTYPALTVTLVENADADSVARDMYGADLTPAASRVAAENATNDGRGWVASGTVGDWAFVWEDNGWLGSDVDTVEDLSRGRRLVSAFWNAHALALATIANNGRVTRQFDPATRTDPQNAIGTALPDENWLDWDHDWTGALLRLQSRLTGQLMATPSWLERPGVRFWTHSLDTSAE